MSTSWALGPQPLVGVKLPLKRTRVRRVGRVGASFAEKRETFLVEAREASKDAMGEVDRKLMARMARADQSALAALYERHSAAVFRTVCVLLRDEALAADAVQDVFLEAWRKADQYDPSRGSVRAWLVVRARSRALDRIRSRNRKGEVSLIDTGRGTLGAVEPMMDEMHLPDAFRVVSEQEREVLVLGYFEGLTCVEISERLNVPVGTVKSRTRTAMKKMRGFWEETRT